MFTFISLIPVCWAESRCSSVASTYLWPARHLTCRLYDCCTFVSRLYVVVSWLYVVVSRLYVGHNITWRSARHTPLNCFQLWRWIPNAISKFGELYLLRHIVKTSGAAMHSRELRHHFWGTKEIFGASAVSEQSKKRLLIVIDKHGLRLQLSWALCWQGYHVTNLNTCTMAHTKTFITLKDMAFTKCLPL